MDTTPVTSTINKPISVPIPFPRTDGTLPQGGAGPRTQVTGGRFQAPVPNPPVTGNRTQTLQQFQAPVPQAQVGVKPVIPVPKPQVNVGVNPVIPVPKPQGSVPQFQTGVKAVIPVPQFQTAVKPVIPVPQFQTARKPVIPVPQFQTAGKPVIPVPQFQAPVPQMQTGGKTGIPTAITKDVYGYVDGLWSRIMDIVQGEYVPIVPVPRGGVEANQVEIEKMKGQKQAQGGILRQFGGGGVTTVVTSPQVLVAPKLTITAETGVSIMTKMMGLWGGSEENIRVLMGLRYGNGKEIVDPKRRDVIVEIMGMLRDQEFLDVIDFLREADNPEYILWEQGSMDEGRTKVQREISIQQAEEVGVRGVGKCRYCPSKELVFAIRQLRSGDEAATIFVRCVMCQKQWRQ